MKKLLLGLGLVTALAFIAATGVEQVMVNSSTRAVINPGVVNFATNKLKVNNVAVVGGGGSPPTGTGFRHVTGSTEDGAAALVKDADVDATSNVGAVANPAAATDGQFLFKTGSAVDWGFIPIGSIENSGTSTLELQDINQNFLPGWIDTDGRYRELRLGGPLEVLGTTPNFTLGFTSAANRGIAQEVYISLRTDGKDGTGTGEDPLGVYGTNDAAKAAKFDTLMQAHRNDHVHLQKDTVFLTDGERYGDNSKGWSVGAGMWISGHGATIRQRSTPSYWTSGGAKHGVVTNRYYEAPADGALIEDLTIDANWQNLDHTATGTNKAIHCLYLYGSGITYRNVHVTNMYGDVASSQECFPCFIARIHPGYGFDAPSANNRMIDCVADNPRGDYCNGFGYIGWPIDFVTAGPHVISDSIFTNCRAYGAFYPGVFGSGYALNIKLGNCFTNGAANGYYCDTGENSGLEILGSTFANCSQQGISFNSSPLLAGFVARGNRITSSRAGISLGAVSQSDLVVVGNAITGVAPDASVSISSGTRVTVHDNPSNVPVSLSPSITGLSFVEAKNSSPKNTLIGALKIEGSLTNSNNTSIWSFALASGYTIVAGDHLQWEVYGDENNAYCAPSLQIFRWTPFFSDNLTDQNGLGTTAEISAYARGKWYFRDCDLASHTGDHIDLINTGQLGRLPDGADVPAGTYRYYYRNIQIVGADGTPKVRYYTTETKVTPSVQTNVNCTNVTAVSNFIGADAIADFRTNLGATPTGSNFFTCPNPSTAVIPSLESGGALNLITLGASQSIRRKADDTGFEAYTPGAGGAVATDTIWDALGDIVYGSGADTGAKLSGNTTTTKKFLRQTGTGSVSAAPAWDTVTKDDVGLPNVDDTPDGDKSVYRARNLYSADANADFIATDVISADLTFDNYSTVVFGTGKAAIFRTGLGLGTAATHPATDFQPADTDLDTWAGITPGTGVGSFLAGVTANSSANNSGHGGLAQSLRIPSAHRSAAPWSIGQNTTTFSGLASDGTEDDSAFVLGFNTDPATNKIVNTGGISGGRKQYMMFEHDYYQSAGGTGGRLDEWHYDNEADDGSQVRNFMHTWSPAGKTSAFWIDGQLSIFANGAGSSGANTAIFNDHILLAKNGYLQAYLQDGTTQATIISLDGSDNVAFGNRTLAAFSGISASMSGKVTATGGASARAFLAIAGGSTDGLAAYRAADDSNQSNYWDFGRDNKVTGNFVARASGQSVDAFQATPTGSFIVKGTTSSTSTTSGALTVAGGAGVVENLYVGGLANVSGKIVSSASTGTTPTITGVTTRLSIGAGTADEGLVMGDGTRGVIFGQYHDGSTTLHLNLFGYDSSGSAKTKISDFTIVSGSLITSQAKFLATQEATTGGAGGLVTDGGIYAAKKIISNTDIVAGGTLSATGASTLTGGMIGGVQALSGAGAVNITTDATALTTTGASQALTLADGTNGQVKKIAHVSDGGSAILTPTTKSGYSTITFTNVGDAVTLQFFTSAGWIITGQNGVTVTP
jgi:hypothetical protein